MVRAREDEEEALMSKATLAVAYAMAKYTSAIIPAAMRTFPPVRLVELTQRADPDVNVVLNDLVLNDQPV